MKRALPSRSRQDNGSDNPDLRLGASTEFERDGGSHASLVNLDVLRAGLHRALLSGKAFIPRGSASVPQLLGLTSTATLYPRPRGNPIHACVRALPETWIKFAKVDTFYEPSPVPARASRGSRR